MCSPDWGHFQDILIYDRIFWEDLKGPAQPRRKLLPACWGQGPVSVTRLAPGLRVLPVWGAESAGNSHHTRGHRVTTRTHVPLIICWSWEISPQTICCNKPNFLQ